MEDIKPCPFCGTKAVKFKKLYKNPAVYFIHRCRVSRFEIKSGTYESKDAAIEAWNKRVPELYTYLSDSPKKIFTAKKASEF